MNVLVGLAKHIRGAVPRRLGVAKNSSLNPSEASVTFTEKRGHRDRKKKKSGRRQGEDRNDSRKLCGVRKSTTIGKGGNRMECKEKLQCLMSRKSSGRWGVELSEATVTTTEKEHYISGDQKGCPDTAHV